MQTDQDLLEAARPYCELTTGEVQTRMPEELMQQLRKAKLAIGVGGRRSQHTESSATWYVYLNDEIRENALALYRESRRLRAKSRGSGSKKSQKADGKPPNRPKKPAAQRGLAQFRRSRKS